MLSPGERRRFRDIERGMRITDPSWLTNHYPRRRRKADLARLAAAMIAAALTSGGVVASAMPIVGCGILLAMGATTSFVSSRSTTVPARVDGARRPGARPSLSCSAATRAGDGARP